VSAHGLSEATLETVRRILAAHPAVERAILFGSRAMGPSHRIDHPGLRAHIQRVGQVLYERSPQEPVLGA
jgi:hypothetical protein